MAGEFNFSGFFLVRCRSWKLPVVSFFFFSPSLLALQDNGVSAVFFGLFILFYNYTAFYSNPCLIVTTFCKVYFGFFFGYGRVVINNFLFCWCVCLCLFIYFSFQVKSSQIKSRNSLFQKRTGIVYHFIHSLILFLYLRASLFHLCNFCLSVLLM